MPSKRTQALSRSSAAHATAVVLEDVRSQNKVVLEAVQGVGQKVDGLAHRMDIRENSRRSARSGRAASLPGSWTSRATSARTR
jgi:hypothetical protein